MGAIWMKGRPKDRCQREGRGAIRAYPAVKEWR